MSKYTPLQLFEKRYRQIRTEYDLKLKKADVLLKKRQENCKHKFTYNSDPSGNHGSFDECDYCGLKQ